jgi:hypothetical protein
MSVQYFTDNGRTGFFHTEHQHFSEYFNDAEVIANNYFEEFPKETVHSVCVVDFRNHLHTMYEFEISRNIECTEF